MRFQRPRWPFETELRVIPLTGGGVCASGVPMIRAMKIMSKVALWLGVLLALVGVGGGIWAGYISWRQWLALDALRSADVQTATIPLLIAGAGLLIGGFLMGLGVGVTPKTPKVTERAEPPAV